MVAHPVPRLSLGSGNFTQERVRTCLNNILRGDIDIRPARFDVLELRHHDWTPVWNRLRLTDEEFGDEFAAARLQKFCEDLADDLKGAEDRLQLLDDRLSPWVGCCIELSSSADTLVQKAIRHLERLPARSTRPSDTLFPTPAASWRTRFFGNDGEFGSWERNPVAGYLDTNTIRVAILAAMQMDSIEGAFGDNYNHDYNSLHAKFVSHLDNLVSIMRESIRLYNKSTDAAMERSYIDLTAFAWTAWQRSLTLTLTDLARMRLAFGFTGSEPGIIMPRFAREQSALWQFKDLPLYICPWAFGIVRTNSYACGADLRTAIARCHQYCRDFDLHEARCVNPNSSTARQCSGGNLADCERFTSVCVDDQSAHSEECTDVRKCAQKRLFWDPESYKSVSGGRAVSIATNHRGGLLQYCSASGRTLTVSHVWSHGQGGRPDHPGSGFNPCLHDRYCRLAKKHDCDSYWIDSACIPNDYNLRKQAISKINDTFAESKATIVCDRDIMRFDIDVLTIDLQEQILSMVLFCDWNVRAWTFLEAMRGRSHLYLLCKNEQTISLKCLLDNVLREGSLDLIALFADNRHLVPLRPKALRHTEVGKIGQELAGMVDTEEAACLISRRHASRPGDEIVIWSLLCGGAPHQTAEAFWKEHQEDDPQADATVSKWSQASRISYDKSFRVAFLMSSAPRLQIEGLQWAPARPAPAAQKQLCGDSHEFYPVRGESSRFASLSPRGLEAAWRFWSFAVTHEEEPWWEFPFNDSYLVNSYWRVQYQIEVAYLQSYKYGALLRPLVDAQRSFSDEDAEMYPRTADDGGDLVVIAGSDTDTDRWTWVTVIVWPDGAGIREGYSHNIVLN